jgi:flagellar biosynthesis protein FlhF
MTEEPAGSMRIKSFFAASVEQAIQEARKELGPDAMLITSRRSSPEARHMGAYEVVFGLQSASAQRTARSSAPPVNADLSSELQHLRAQLQDIKSSLQGPRSSDSATSDADEVIAQLIAFDLSRTVASDIVSAAAILRDQSRESSSLESYTAKVAAQRLRIAGSPQMEPGKVIVFAGPAGAGKTTTLIKTAIREGLANRLPLRIISADPYRVAAHEKLRSFAGIIGVGFAAVNSVQELTGAIEEARVKNIVLVDTPGFSPADLGQAKEIAGSLERTANKLVHLVLPASMKRESMTRCVREFSAFTPNYLLFTKLDETDTLGALLSTALEADLPLSFFSGGQNIPEDLEPANPAALIASVFRRETAEAVTAA